MKLKFLGAAREVTGSCFLVEAAGLRFLRPGELRLADRPVFNQYAPFLRTAHFVRSIPR